jgi:hypothetical protein
LNVTLVDPARAGVSRPLRILATQLVQYLAQEGRADMKGGLGGDSLDQRDDFGRGALAATDGSDEHADGTVNPNPQEFGSKPRRRIIGEQ